jgi:N-acetylneuraminic acid mutarotase
MISGRRQTSLVRPKRDAVAPTTVAADTTQGIYVTGGNNQDCGLGLISDVDRYTLDDAWIARAPLICPDRQGHGAVTLAWSGTETALHVIGGNIGSNTYLVDCDRYVVDNWTQRANMPPPARYTAAAFAWQQRYGIYAGGRNYAGGADYPPLRDVDQYDPSTNLWRAYPSLPYPRADQASFSLSGIGYMHGGWQESGPGSPVTSLYSFNGSWILRTPSPSPGRAEHRGFVIGAYGYVVGGRSIVSPYEMNDLDRYDRVTDTWTEKANMPDRRTFHSASGLGDAGYMHGGEDEDGATPDTCYGYDETQGWFATAPLPAPTRYLAAAATL